MRTNVETALLFCLAAVVAKYRMSPWTNTTKPCQQQCQLAPQHFEATTSIRFASCNVRPLDQQLNGSFGASSVAVTDEYEHPLIHNAVNRLDVSALVLLLTFSSGKILTVGLAQETRMMLYKGTMSRIMYSWVSQYHRVGLSLSRQQQSLPAILSVLLQSAQLVNHMTTLS